MALSSAAPAHEILGGDGHGLHMVEVDAGFVPETTPVAVDAALLGGDDHGKQQQLPETPLLGGDDHGKQQQLPETPLLGGDDHGKQQQLPELPQNETAIAATGFDWSVTKYLNDTVCYADGDGDGDANHCVSSLYYHSMVYFYHFWTFVMVAVIISQAFRIRRITRAHNALVLRTAGLMADNFMFADVATYASRARDTAMLVPPAYPAADVKGRYSHSEA
jgi:hypothetical protein